MFKGHRMRTIRNGNLLSNKLDKSSRNPVVWVRRRHRAESQHLFHWNGENKNYVLGVPETPQRGMVTSRCLLAGFRWQTSFFYCLIPAVARLLCNSRHFYSERVPPGKRAEWDWEAYIAKYPESWSLLNCINLRIIRAEQMSVADCAPMQFQEPPFPWASTRHTTGNDLTLLLP